MEQLSWVKIGPASIFYLLFSINCKKNFEKCFFFKQVEIFKLEVFFLKAYNSKLWVDPNEFDE